MVHAHGYNITSQFVLFFENKMSRSRSSVWEDFVKVDSKSAVCNICNNVVQRSGNTTNLTNHLKRYHPEHGKTKIVENTTELQVADVTLSDIPAEPKNTNSEKHSRKRKNQMPIDDIFKDIDSFKNGGYKEVALTDALIYMVAVDNLTLNTSEKKGFKKLIKVAAPLYKPPSRRTLTRAIDAKYEFLSEKIKLELADVKALCLTSDAWKNNLTCQTYLGLTVHYYKFEKLQSIKLGTFPLEESHTGEYISEKLATLCKDWKIELESVVAVITDNAANMVKAINLTFGREKQLGCFAHSLQLVPTNAIKFTPGLSALISSVKRLVTFFKQSTNASDELRKLQLLQGKTEGTIRRLIQDVDTRWNSEFSMAKRFIEMAPLVSAVLVLQKGSPPMLNRDDMETLQELVEMLSPIEQITRELSAQDYVTCSAIIPMVNCLTVSLNNMEAVKPITRHLKQILLTEIEERFRNIENVPIYAKATILDPRFKTIHFKSALAVATAMKKIASEMRANNSHNMEILTEPISTSSTPIRKQNSADIWMHHDKIVDKTLSNVDEAGGLPVELRQYKNQAVLHRSENPIEHWEKLKLAFPQVYSVAIRYLPVVATSVPSESLFSLASNIETKYRSRIHPDRLSELTFMASLSEEQWGFPHAVISKT
ncbi:E3 SUMO-protein ligase ZBED1-like isoform X1 [Leptopilina heterotoma]|uniref:E3 SUMO-protein ligase ZBED1-like isoform X1 n=1 Tax=Leptopilina heterotoma TaxID=63436 RepID=UPI001CA974D3|nr:E3 SUMO-protein ligase ZBED1-like isoform X1 [Leptopilina heterotoma]